MRHARVTRWAVLVVAAAGLVRCHPNDHPPVPPPKPTNPTAVAGPPSGTILDASIVYDGSPDWDGGVFVEAGLAAARR